MKNDTMNDSCVSISNMSGLTSEDIPTMSIDTLEDLDSIDLSWATPLSGINSSTSNITYGSGSYIYGSGSSPTITLGPSVYSNTSWATAPLTVNNGNGISVNGDADISGNLKVNGVDIGEMLSNIQDKLAIYQPAPELEEKWEELRDLARKYKELVADIKEKEKIWNILQK